MSLTEEQTPLEPPDNESLAIVVNKFDEQKNSLFELSTQYYKKPIEANYDSVIDKAYEVTEASLDFTKTVFQDRLMSAEQKAEVIGRIFLKEMDRSRS